MHSSSLIYVVNFALVSSDSHLQIAESGADTNIRFGVPRQHANANNIRFYWQLFLAFANIINAATAYDDIDSLRSMVVSPPEPISSWAAARMMILTLLSMMRVLRHPPPLVHNHDLDPISPGRRLSLTRQHLNITLFMCRRPFPSSLQRLPPVPQLRPPPTP